VIAASTVSPTRRNAASPRRDEGWLGVALSVPATLLLLTIHVVPLAVLLVLSVTDYELGATASRWIGLDNYAKAFDDPVFRRSIANTLLYVAIVLPGGVLLALLVALLVHARTRTRSFYEVVFFLPVTSTLIAMATVWQFILHPRLGPVNALLKSIGLGEIAFLSTPGLVIPTIAMIGLWQVVGFNMVLFLAGLSAIPRDLYDAAEIDGASGSVDRFLQITWPMLGPTTLFVTVTTSITAFKVFDTVASLTRGADGTEVLLYAIYLEGFQYFNMGYAAALTVVFLAFILAFSIGQAFLADRKVHYG
jgi:multiple sugar transport system permease protein